jgi:predicted nuclease with TOPRIM domain
MSDITRFQILNDMWVRYDDHRAEVERLTGERDAAEAEVERLTAERDEVREKLTRVQVQYDEFAKVTAVSASRGRR